MAKASLEFGIQQCSKCQYKLRCDECVYNEKDIAELIKFEKQQTRKDTAREILQKFYKQFVVYTCVGDYYTDSEINGTIQELAKHFGVEVEE